MKQELEMIKQVKPGNNAFASLKIIKRPIVTRIKRTFLSLLTGMIVLAAQAQDSMQSMELLQLSIEELLQIQVFTASRELTTIEKAPSVVSVITAQDIKIQGLKNLRDVLDRVSGFHIQQDRNYSLITTRGFALDPTNNILLLVDGNNINSQAGEGIGNTHLLPFLYQVKQIEVIHGPGSTLWGGDAAFGIINIITYSGSEMVKEEGEQTLTANIDYEFDTQRKVSNLLYGSRFSEGDLMVSASYTEADGNHLLVYDIYTDNEQVVSQNFRVRHDQHRPSYEVQAKANWRDFSVNTRLFKHQGYYRNISEIIENELREYEFNFIDLKYSPKISDTLSWDNALHYNSVDEGWRRKLIDGTVNWGWKQRYDGAGLTSILTYAPEQYSLKTGVQLTYRDYDGRKLFAGPSSTLVPESISGAEKNYGVFTDLTYKDFDDWLLVLGVRYQHNGLRQKGDFVLPRTALIYQATDEWTIKYAYNTGFVGTTLNRRQSTRDNFKVQSDGEILLGPEKPMETKSNDLQFSYSKNKFNADLSFFAQELKNYIFEGKITLTDEKIDGYPVWVREVNTGKIDSLGLEFNWSWKPNKNFSFYGNYSRVRSEFETIKGISAAGTGFDLVEDNAVAKPDGQFTGVPEHVWNMGLNYIPLEFVTLNLHYRGWTKAWGKQLVAVGEANVFERFGPEHFVDAAVNFHHIPGKNFRLQIYGRNILNNIPIFPMSTHIGATQGNGRELGISLYYTF